MKPMFWVWSCTSPNYPKFKWGNTGWALPFVMVSSGLKCFRMRNDPFLGLHNFWQASASKQTLVLGQRVDLMEFARSFTVNIHTFSLTNSGTWNRLEIAGRWSIPKLDYQYQRVYRLVGHQSCPFLVGLVSRFPAVHRPLLTYVNTAFVAPAIGHQVGHELSGDQTRCGSEEVIGTIPEITSLCRALVRPWTWWDFGPSAQAALSSLAWWLWWYLSSQSDIFDIFGYLWMISFNIFQQTEIDRITNGKKRQWILALAFVHICTYL